MRSGNETIRPIKWEKNASYWKMKLDSCSTSSKRRDKCRGRDLGKANHVSYFPLTSFQRSYQISSSLFMVPFKKAPEASSRIPCWKFGISDAVKGLNLYCHRMDAKKTFGLFAILVFLLQLCLSSGESLNFLFLAYLIYSKEFNCLYYCSSSQNCWLWFTSRKI